jgi:hypothetical protein
MMMDAQAEPSIVAATHLLLYISYTMSGAPRKQEKDYSEEVKTLQPQAEELAKVSYNRRYIEADSQNGNLQGAIDKITGLEKQTRNVSCSFLFISRPS